MTVAELETELAAVNSQRSELSQKAKEIAAELDSVRTLEAAKQKFASMPDAERLALAQVLNAQGIASAEAFGKM